MRRITAIALLPTAALALTACGGDTDQAAESGPAATLTTAGSPTSEGATTPTATSSPTGSDSDDDSATAAAGAGSALLGTPAGVGGPYGELRDGVWGVGPAGEVEFRVTGSDTLELVEVRVNDGWEITGQESDSDSIDVDYRQGPVDYQIEVEIDDGVLEIEIDQDIDPAEAGTFALGEAGSAEVTLSDGRLVLGAVTVTDGWSETSREVDDDEIELDLRREGMGFFELWELKADLDDGGLDIEVDYEIEGRFAG